MNVKEVKPFQVSANNKKRKFASRTSEGFVYQTLRPGSKKTKKKFLYDGTNDRNLLQTRSHVEQHDHFQPFRNPHPFDSKNHGQQEVLYPAERTENPIHHQIQNRPGSRGSQMFSTSESNQLENEMTSNIDYGAMKNYGSSNYERNDFTTPSESRFIDGGINNDFETSMSFQSKNSYRHRDSRIENQNDNEIGKRNYFTTPETITNEEIPNDFETTASYQSRYHHDLPSGSSIFPNHSDHTSKPVQDTVPPADYYSEVLACNQRLAYSMSRRSTSSLSQTQFTHATSCTTFDYNKEDGNEDQVSEESLEWVDQGATPQTYDPEFPPLNIFPNTVQKQTNCYDLNNGQYSNNYTPSHNCQQTPGYSSTSNANNRELDVHDGRHHHGLINAQSSDVDFGNGYHSSNRSPRENYYTPSQQHDTSRSDVQFSKLTSSADNYPSSYGVQSDAREQQHGAHNFNFYTRRKENSTQPPEHLYRPTENRRIGSSSSIHQLPDNSMSHPSNQYVNDHCTEEYDELQNELDDLAKNIFESPSTDTNNNETVFQDAYLPSTDANNDNPYADVCTDAQIFTRDSSHNGSLNQENYHTGLGQARSSNTFSTSRDSLQHYSSSEHTSAIEPIRKVQRTDRSKIGHLQPSHVCSSSGHLSDIAPNPQRQGNQTFAKEMKNKNRNEYYQRLLSPKNTTSYSMNGDGQNDSNHAMRDGLFSPPSATGGTNEFDSPQLTEEVVSDHNTGVVSSDRSMSTTRHATSFMYFNKPTFESPLVRRKSEKNSSAFGSGRFDFDLGLEPKPKASSTPIGHTPFSFLTPTPTKEFVTYMSSSTSSKTCATPSGDLTRNRSLYKGKTSSKSRSVTSSSTEPQHRSSSEMRTPRGSKTPQMRTPGSATSATTEGSNAEQTNVIMAITEGRGQARGEVGIAAIDTKHPHLVLCQISDSPTYIHTLTKIHVLNPVQIIMPNTITENSEYNKLFNLIKDKFEHIELTSVLRRYFSDSQGLDYIRRTCLPEYNNVILLVLHKFYALSATCALVKYVEFVQNIIFLSRSLQVKYQASENVTFIDFETSQKLELVLSQSNKLKSKCNLYGMLNHCQTHGGQRKLRSTILQPSCNSRVIKQRLDCVTELIENPRLLCEIQTSLKKFSEIEHLLSLCYEPTSLNKESKKHFEQQIKLTLLLKSALESLPSLTQALADCCQPQFKSFKENFSDPRFKSILSLIEATIRTDAAPAKGYALSQMQRCFAIKENINSLLDVARTVYSEIVDDIYNKAREISQEFDLPLRVSNSSTRAFHLSFVTRKNFKVSELPPVFINVTLNKARTCVTMTTEEIIFMNQRIKAALDEVHSMTNLIIRDLLKKAHEHMSCIYKLCENVAELDLIVSLAQVSSSNNFVQPSFGSRINVTASRHPLLDFISPTEPVANDILCTRWKNFHVITGPNMSGKSIYIKQVALLQIMAQVGCYVPAEKAEFRLTDHIYTRIGFNDSIECNASTFAMEMKEMAHILQFVTPASLILVDELCRGTSTDEGTSLAWAICESLIQTKAFVFFTTHFLLLSQLGNIYSNVTNYHLEAKYKDTEQKTGVIYTHKLLLGVTSIEHYGLKLAEKTGLPRSIIEEAKILATRLLREKQTNMDQDWTKRTNRTNEDIVQKLLEHYEDGTLSIETARNVLEPFQELNARHNETEENTEVPDIEEFNNENRNDIKENKRDSQNNIDEEFNVENSEDIQQNMEGEDSNQDEETQQDTEAFDSDDTDVHQIDTNGNDSNQRENEEEIMSSEMDEMEETKDSNKKQEHEDTVKYDKNGSTFKENTDKENYNSDNDQTNIDKESGNFNTDEKYISNVQRISEEGGNVQTELEKTGGNSNEQIMALKKDTDTQTEDEARDKNNPSDSTSQESMEKSQMENGSQYIENNSDAEYQGDK